MCTSVLMQVQKYVLISLLYSADHFYFNAESRYSVELLIFLEQSADNNNMILPV